MRKKGFTLIELLGVITILGIIMVLVFPPIMEQIRKTKGELNSATKAIIETATDLYIDNHQNSFPKKNGNIYCVSLQTLVDENYLSAPIKDINGKEVSLENRVKVTVNNTFYQFEYMTGTCTEFIQ